MPLLCGERTGVVSGSSLLICTENGPSGDADKILDYLEVVHVFIRRAHPRR